MKLALSQVKNSKAIFAWETAVYMNTKNNYGWALKGNKCIIKERDNKIYKKKYSLLMAISNKKVIHYELSRGFISIAKQWK